MALVFLEKEVVSAKKALCDGICAIHLQHNILGQEVIQVKRDYTEIKIPLDLPYRLR